jgi:hypothetical protein
MGIAGKLRRLQKAMRGNLETIEQCDGSTVYVDPERVFWDTFTYWGNCAQADYNREPRPEPPPVLQAVANARDRRAALDKIMQGATHIPFDESTLVERGEFAPRQMAVGYPPVREVAS